MMGEGGHHEKTGSKIMKYLCFVILVNRNYCILTVFLTKSLSCSKMLISLGLFRSQFIKKKKKDCCLL